MVRFIHAADPQLGLVGQFRDADARARYAQARFDALTSIGALAASENAAFVIVAGDLFVTNHVRPRTVVRAMEALASIPVPVYVLPGSHDPLDAATVFRSPTFLRSRPEHVTVLDSPEPVEPPGAPGIRIIGAPWRSRRPLSDPTAQVVATLAPALAHDPAPDPAPGPDVQRILVAHGPLDSLSDVLEPYAIRQGPLEDAVGDRRVEYVALGGRHPTTRVGGSGRVWYAGTPEVTDFDVPDTGNVLVVDLDGDRCDVGRRQVGAWRLRTETVALDTGLGPAALRARLDMLPAKDRTVVRLLLTGRISLTEHHQVERIVADARLSLASLDGPMPTDELVIRPVDADFADLGLTGFASAAVERLRQLAAGADATAQTARDALSLLVRLAKGEGVAP